MRSGRRLGGIAVLAALTMTALTACGGNDTPKATGTQKEAPAAALGVAKPGVLKIGTTNNIKPYAYEENGELTGFEIDLIKAAAAKLSLQPELISLEFAALLPAVNNRQFDVVASAVGITEERKKMVEFSDGYLAGYFGVLASDKTGIKDVGAVNGKRVGVLQGSIQDTQSAKLIPGAVIVRFPDTNSADLALKNTRIDAFFTDYDTGLAIKKKYPDAGFDMPVTIPATDFPAGWAVKKGNDQLREALNGALKQVVADGTWLQLYKKYFPEAPVPRSAELPPYAPKV